MTVPPRRADLSRLLYWSTMVVLISVAASSARAEHRPPSSVPEPQAQILYGTHSELCQKLRAIYQDLAGRPEKWFLEDAYVLTLRAAGFLTPAELSDDNHINTKNPFSGFYRLDLDNSGQPRLVYLRDTLIGHRGLAQTNLWILKPGASGIWEERRLSIQVDGMPKEIQVEGFDPKEVELAVFLGHNPLDATLYPHITARFFDKATEHHTDASLPDMPMIGGPGTVQRIFLFGKSKVFIARKYTSIVAYIFRAGTIVDECYIHNESRQ